MNTIDDLRGTLDRHATLPDHDVHVRAGAVHERVRVVRRRRRAAATLAAAGAATVVVGVVALVPHRGDPSPQPVAPGPSQSTPSHPTPSGAPAPSFPPRLSGGERLVASFAGDAGQAELRFQVPAKGPTKLWSVYCAPARSGWFTVTFNGVEREFGQCGTASGSPGSGWSSFDNLVTRSGAPLGPDDTIEVDIKLYEHQGSHVLASRPDIRLGTGVYVK